MSRAAEGLERGTYIVTKFDEILGDAKIFWESLEKRLGESLEYAKEVNKQLGVPIKLQENQKVFIPPKDISSVRGKWAEEWKAVEKFWRSCNLNGGSLDVFEKYWVWSHVFLELLGVSPHVERVEICDIKYTMHYMRQGAFSEEYAKKIVAMTKAIVKGGDYLLCEKDASMEELIEPNTLYLFKSIDKRAQEDFIKLMLEVKAEMASGFEKFYITSGKRSPFIHAHTHIRRNVPKKTAHENYGVQAKTYYFALEDAYHGETIRWGEGPYEIEQRDKDLIRTIPKGDIDKVVEVSIQLMEQENTKFEGTDHRSSSTLDIAPTLTGEKLFMKVRSLGFFAYQPKSKKFYHISFVKKQSGN